MVDVVKRRLKGYEDANSDKLVEVVMENVTPVTLTTTLDPETAVTPGSGITLEVAVAGDDADKVTAQWYKDGNAIPGATGLTYTKESAETSDSGVYKVVVTTPGGYLSSSTTVTVSAG